MAQLLGNRRARLHGRTTVDLNLKEEKEEEEKERRGGKRRSRKRRRDTQAVKCMGEFYLT